MWRWFRSYYGLLPAIIFIVGYGFLAVKTNQRLEQNQNRIKQSQAECEEMCFSEYCQ